MVVVTACRFFIVFWWADIALEKEMSTAVKYWLPSSCVGKVKSSYLVQSGLLHTPYFCLFLY